MTDLKKQQEEYWTNRWKQQQTGWHLADPHPSLVANLKKLVVPSASDRPAVFVPLCGKSVDLGWLRSEGYRAIGSELSELAVSEFFSELGETPQKSECSGALQKWEVDGITMYVGDIFEITDLGDVSAVFDRAALVALPGEIRGKYVEHVKKITHNANQVLVTFEHTRDSAPPHSIPESLVKEYYADTYSTEFVSKRNVGDKIDEATYLLRKKN